MIGQVIGNYRIVSELGRGGMGVVYRAEHVQLGRPAALKVLLPQLSSDAQIVQRFWNEARAASSIDHPGIVEIYDFGRHTDGSAFIVMALLKGESLDHRLMRPIAPLEAASLIAQVAGALAAAHARGIVHRDLKPDNIYLVPNELLPGGIQVKLLDFGIAKLADEKASGFRTQTGILIGTPAYMSPEQCMGRADLDHRTDLYSIGCILYHMLCGRPPFLSEQGTGVMIAMHLRDPVPDPRSLAPHLPEPLVAIMLRLLEKDPAARYQTAQELRQALVMAGAIAPITAPGAGAGAGQGPDPYGATLAPSAPTPAPRSLGDAYAATAAPGYGGTAPGYGGTAPGYGGTAPAYGGTAPVMAATASPTTRSGAAAEQMTRPERGGAPARGSGGKRGAWIAVGALLLAIGGVGVGVAVTRDGGSIDDAGGRIALPGPEDKAKDKVDVGTPAGSALRPDEVKPLTAQPPEPPKPPEPPGTPPETATAEAPCPSGQLRSDDTRGNCCWSGQAWSTTKQRCVGAPTCPPGTRVNGEQCAAVLAEAEPVKPVKPGAPAVPPPPDDTFVGAPGPTIQLGASSFAPGASIAIKFSRAVRSTSSRRAWVTVAPAGSTPTAYGTWEFVADGAQQAKLAAPAKPGAYEVRLHTDYPTKSFNLVRAVPFAVTEPVAIATDQAQDGATPRSGQRFTLASSEVTVGDKVAVRFPGPLRAASGEQFWITVIDRSAADTEWGQWQYVPAAARAMTLPAPTKDGTYEVRLHANYPKKATNVVFRARLLVNAP